MEAAARLFAERGYSGASMTDIAAAAGIAPSVIYDHFASKRDLHRELLSRHAHALIEATTWRMLFRDPPADDEIAAVHARIHRHGTAAIAGLIHLAPVLHLPAGVARERGDEMLARAMKSTNDGLAAWWYEHPEVPREQVVEVAIGLCWRGLAVLTGAVRGPNP